MPHPRFSSQEISERGKQLYEQLIRAQVETEENIGKLVSIDVETGDYEVGTDNDLEAPRRLHAKHSDAAIYSLRIGYDAAYALGGVGDVRVLATGKRPLLGTALLDGYGFNARFAEGGLITVDDL